MKQTPLSLLQEKFQSKDKLIDVILDLVKRPAELTKEQMKKKLQVQSNRKLMALYAREVLVKDKFGGRDKLVEAIASSGKGQNKGESKEHRRILAGKTTGELLDIARKHNLPL